MLRFFIIPQNMVFSQNRIFVQCLENRRDLNNEYMESIDSKKRHKAQTGAVASP